MAWRLFPNPLRREKKRYEKCPECGQRVLVGERNRLAPHRTKVRRFRQHRARCHGSGGVV